MILLDKGGVKTEFLKDGSIYKLTSQVDADRKNVVFLSEEDIIKMYNKIKERDGE